MQTSHGSGDVKIKTRTKVGEINNITLYDIFHVPGVAWSQLKMQHKMLVEEYSNQKAAFQLIKEKNS